METDRPREMTDSQWASVAPLIPPPHRLGRKRDTDMRQVVNAILLRVETGVYWRNLPDCYPPWPTVYEYFKQWRRAGILEPILQAARADRV